MREHYRARGLRFPDVASDTVGHLSVRGHLVAADVLREAIARAEGRL